MFWQEKKMCDSEMQNENLKKKTKKQLILCQCVDLTHYYKFIMSTPEVWGLNKLYQCEA